MRGVYSSWLCVSMNSIKKLPFSSVTLILLKQKVDLLLIVVCPCSEYSLMPLVAGRSQM